MADDLIRIWSERDGEQGPIFLSEADLVKTLSPHMIRTSEEAFKLLRQEIPSIAKLAVKEFILEQEEMEGRVLKKHGVEKPANLNGRQQVMEMASGKHGPGMMLLGIGMIMLGLGVLAHAPFLKSFIPF